MSNLITVPCFNFSQGEIFEGAEMPITVCYYNGSEEKVLIELQQEDRTISFTSIVELKALVKQVEKHLTEATKKLQNK